MADLEVFGLWFELCFKITHECVIKAYLPFSTEKKSCTLVESDRDIFHLSSWTGVTNQSAVLMARHPALNAGMFVLKRGTIPHLFLFLLVIGAYQL